MASGTFGWGGKCYASALVAERLDGAPEYVSFVHKITRYVVDYAEFDYIDSIYYGTKTNYQLDVYGDLSGLKKSYSNEWDRAACIGGMYPDGDPPYSGSNFNMYNNINPTINPGGFDKYYAEDGVVDPTSNAPYEAYSGDNPHGIQESIDKASDPRVIVGAQVAFDAGPSLVEVFTDPLKSHPDEWIDNDPCEQYPGKLGFYESVDIRNHYEAWVSPNSIKVRYYSTLNVNWVDMGDGTERAVDYAFPLFSIPNHGYTGVDYSNSDSHTTYSAGSFIDNIDNPVTYLDPSESGVTDAFIDLGFRTSQINTGHIKVSYGAWFDSLADLYALSGQFIELFEFDESGDVIEGSINMSMIVSVSDGTYFYDGGGIRYRGRTTPVDLPPDPPSEEEEEKEDPELLQKDPDEYWKVRVRHKPEFPTRTRTSKLVNGEYFRKIVRDLNHDRLNFQTYMDTPFEFDSTGFRNDLEDVKLGRQSTNDMEGFEDRRVLKLVYNDTKVNGSVMTANVGTPSLNEVKQPAGLMENQEAMLCFKRICEPMILNTEIEMYNKAGTLIKKKTHRHQVNYKPNENQTHNTDEILGILNT